MEFKGKKHEFIKEAYKDNVNMFRQVNDEFPLDEADKLIEKLTQCIFSFKMLTSGRGDVSYGKQKRPLILQILFCFFSIKMFTF